MFHGAEEITVSVHLLGPGSGSVLLLGSSLPSLGLGLSNALRWQIWRNGFFGKKRHVWHVRSSLSQACLFFVLPGWFEYSWLGTFLWVCFTCCIRFYSIFLSMFLFEVHGGRSKWANRMWVFQAELGVQWITGLSVHCKRAEQRRVLLVLCTKWQQHVVRLVVEPWQCTKAQSMYIDF